MPRILITGSAGFIGFHMAKELLREGWKVWGYDGMSDYYDVSLKKARHAILAQNPNFRAQIGLLEDSETLRSFAAEAAPDVIIHLAAQAGVRYSIENPRVYLEANIIGTYNVMEEAKRHQVRHLLMASTSSVYGANKEMPYSETDKCDTQMSFYAATKKANEAMTHAWAHIHSLPTTMFRFFTVYGPWGRPDMALFKFTKAILEGRPIDVYNHGEMYRDFTYVSDLVRGISLLIDTPPPSPANRPALIAGDSLSPVAPWRVVNIGNSQKVRLLDFVEAIEAALGRPAIRNYMEIQPGDVPATWADADLLRGLTGYAPQTDIATGVIEFVNWYREYYQT